MKLTPFASDNEVAGNSKHEITTPDGKLYRVLFGGVNLTTDGTVANRWVRVALIAPDGHNILCMCSGAVVTASHTDQRHTYIQGIYRETAFINNVIQVPVASELYLPSGYTLRTFVENGVAGDKFHCDWMVEEHDGY